MSSKRVIVTGGCGKVGRFVVARLLSEGYEVLNLDLIPPPEKVPALHTVRVDLCDSGQVYSALCSHFKLTEPFLEPYRPADAIIHLAGYARNMIVPDNETFKANVVSAFNVIEAACRLGIKKVVLASSICVYGVTYAEGNVDFTSFPVDEAVPPRPMDPYSLSKLCMENTAQAFAARFPHVDIYVLRLGAVIEPGDYKSAFCSYLEQPDHWKVHGWSYVDARDLAQMCVLCLQTSGLGFQVFNATNDDITNGSETTEFLARVCPGVRLTRPLGAREAPISNQKIKTLLKFREQHKWQMYVNTSEAQQ